MGQYTEFLEDMTYNVYDTEDYLEAFEDTVKIFRTFDKALDTFILEHGFDGDITSQDDKVRFISNRFKAAGIPVSSNIKKWYLEHKAIEKETAFKICFAFGLNLEEVDVFLRKICLYRGFDCHSMEEVVYFFAFRNHINYKAVQTIIQNVGSIKPGKIDTDDIVYTNAIYDELEEIETEQDLIEYLAENVTVFAYNNATATKLIQELWRDVSDEQGIAIKEKKRLYDSFDDEEKIDDDEQSNRRKERKRVIDSIWEIYLQMLGLSGNYSAKFYKTRNIKKILKDNTMLHPLAEYSFPDRDGLNKILNGEHLSDERIRKILILLVFYRFWANKALLKNNYSADYSDDDRCRNSIDAYLVNAGYPCLYAGNPYDFIFLFANNSETPLFTFREYMRELYFLKNDEVYSDYID